MDRLKKLMAAGTGIPMGIPNGIPEETPGTPGAGIMNAWQNDVSLIPSKNRYQYALNQQGMDEDVTSALQNYINSAIPSENNAGHFANPLSGDAKEGQGKMTDLVNQGLWKILLKDKKDIDENDLGFIQTVNKLIQHPTIKEDEKGMGQYRYYFDPVMYLNKKGVKI